MMLLCALPIQAVQVRHRRTCREARAPEEFSSARLKRGTPQLKVVKTVTVSRTNLIGISQEQIIRKEFSK